MRIFLLISAVLQVTICLADDSLDQRISQLLQAMETSNCQFIRNGKVYSSAESTAHVRKKYQHFKEDINSVAEFIELTASRSLISKKPYQVQCGTGAPENSSSWLASKALELGIN